MKTNDMRSAYRVVLSFCLIGFFGYSVWRLEQVRRAVLLIESRSDLADRPSQELIDRLDAIQATLADRSQWPETGKAAQGLYDEWRGLVRRITPAVEQELLPRLNELRWEIEGLRLRATAKEAKPAEMDVVAANCRSLLAAEPDNETPALSQAISWLATDLIAARDRADAEALKYRRSVAIQQAKNALDGETTIDASNAWSDLEPFLMGRLGKEDPDVSTLRRNLRLKLLATSTEDRLKLLAFTLRRAQGSGDERLQQAGLSRVYDAAIGLWLDLDVEEPRPTKALTRVESLLGQCDVGLKKLRLLQDAKRRDYQKWALQQILHFGDDNGWHYDATITWINQELKSFETPTGKKTWILLLEFPSTRKLLEEMLEIDLSDVKDDGVLTVEKQQAIYKAAYQGKLSAWKNHVDKEIAYRTTRDGMVKFLLPINLMLLDPPVADFYNKAFRKGWENLNDRPDQLYVAEQAAVMPKKGIE